MQVLPVRETMSRGERNKRLSKTKKGGDESQLVPEGFDPYHRVYICTHGWKKRKSRGTGSRPRQHIRLTDCPFRFVVQWNVARGELQVKNGFFVHNHKLSPSSYATYPSSRGVDNRLVAARVEGMLAVGAKRSKIYDCLLEHDQNVIRVDVDNMVRGHASSVATVDDNDATARELAVFAAADLENVFAVAETADTITIMTMNEFGEGAVVQQSLLEANGDWHMERAVAHFKRLHPTRIDRLRVIVVDKDLNEIKVLESNFPRARVERRKREKLRKSRSGTETLQAVSAGQTQELETTVETLSILTRTSIGLQYKKMRLNNPPTLASELMSLPVTSWKRFARELHDGRIEQICILSDVERMTCEAGELNQLISEGADALSAKSKKERFDEQGWDSLKASPFYKVLREYKDVLPDDIPAELPHDKGVQHEIDLVPGTKYCVTRQWPLPRAQVKAIDDFFESRRNAGQVRESKSPHSAPTFCVKKPQGGWRIVHAYNKLNDATVPAQTPIPRKDVIIDSMTSSTIFSTLNLRDGFYQILMRESDIPLTAVSTPSGMLWEWLVIPQGLKNAQETFNRCITHLLRSVRDFASSYFDDVFIHSRAVNGKSDVEMHTEHLRKLLELMRKHKLYANLKKCIFGATEIPVLGCLVGKNGVRPDPGKVRVINEWPTPSNVKELRQFLGLATYLCKYVSNYAGKVRPLSQLLKKEAAWEWTADCQQAFEAVKQGLTEAPILAVADQDRPFHVVS
uniref:Reverse transcriptase domain-containing protein n=1 Tax=Phytophthora ramorum TaxID=164328 RepID=H3GHK2_PHYRM